MQSILNDASITRGGDVYWSVSQQENDKSVFSIHILLSAVCSMQQSFLSSLRTTEAQFCTH